VSVLREAMWNDTLDVHDYCDVKVESDLWMVGRVVDATGTHVRVRLVGVGEELSLVPRSSSNLAQVSAASTPAYVCVHVCTCTHVVRIVPTLRCA
jgi:hypothetical protein